MDEITERFGVPDTKSVSPTAPEVFPSLGFCIYCRARGTEVKLTREHVMPDGLGGSILFLKASCEDCAAKTKAFETKVMRGPLLVRRLRAGLVGRPDEIKPLTLRMRDAITGAEKAVTFAPMSHPDAVMLPVLEEPPGYFLQRDTRTFCASYRYFGNASELGAAGIDEQTQVVAKFDLQPFSLMLAKIAHGLALGRLGPDAFEPWLPDLILGRGSRHPSYYVGRWPNDTLANGEGASLNHLGIGIFGPLQDGSRYVMVRVRLFASHEMSPSYGVLVGRYLPPRQPARRKSLIGQGRGAA